MLAPNNPNVMDTLGYVFLKNGKNDEALKLLKRAADLSPENPSMQYHLALAYNEQGNKAEARESLQRALKLGNFPEAKEASQLLEKLKKA